VDTQGDAVFAVFPRARDALVAAIAAQRAVLAHPWPNRTAPKVRIGPLGDHVVVVHHSSADADRDRRSR
jgi:hypothetical protein